MLKKIVVIGAGGFGTEAIWVLEEMNKAGSVEAGWEIIGFADDDVMKKGQLYYDYETLGTPEEVAEKYIGQEIWYFCAIGSNRIRYDVVQRLDNLGWKAATLVHPSVIVARNVVIAEGTYIGAGAILCPNVNIGRHVVVNTRVAVGHDAVVEEFSQLCPGAQINGFCVIAQGAVVGSNASIMPGKFVGIDATVGGNSQVVCNVKDGVSVYGVPALVIKRSQGAKNRRTKEEIK